MLICNKDNRQEAIERDPKAIEISGLIARFLGMLKMNSVSVQVCAKSKCKVDLIVPGCYRARPKRRKLVNILS